MSKPYVCVVAILVGWLHLGAIFTVVHYCGRGAIVLVPAMLFSLFAFTACWFDHHCGPKENPPG